jgi:NADP-dependent 3-hydroxy acid dehydrogenase YdfG
MAALTYWLAPPVAPDMFAQQFPHATSAIGARRLSGLAQTSRLVGMICPGLHSIYASLSVDLTDPISGPDGIGFKTRKVDDRFRRVDMDVQGDGLTGQVSTFARIPPVEAPDMQDIAKHVEPGEFAGTTALVAGGSRGLGAITAQIIAAGGGQVVITYASGQGDADRLAAQINGAIGQTVCTTRKLDALQAVAPQLDGLPGQITQLYYLATPQIFVQKTALFQPELYTKFSRVYVDAFYEACTALTPGLLAAFYPSSVAVEARPKGMTEYSMAKSAGEMLCADMIAGIKGLRILIDRLPRILTDQTATVASAEAADPIEVMLPLIRALHAA